MSVNVLVRVTYVKRVNRLPYHSRIILVQVICIIPAISSFLIESFFNSRYRLFSGIISDSRMLDLLNGTVTKVCDSIVVQHSTFASTALSSSAAIQARLYLRCDTGRCLLNASIILASLLTMNTSADLVLSRLIRLIAWYKSLRIRTNRIASKSLSSKGNLPFTPFIGAIVRTFDEMSRPETIDHISGYFSIGNVALATIHNCVKSRQTFLPIIAPK